jgi:hypothetical protein
MWLEWESLCKRKRLASGLQSFRKREGFIWRSRGRARLLGWFLAFLLLGLATLPAFAFSISSAFACFLWTEMLAVCTFDQAVKVHLMTTQLH